MNKSRNTNILKLPITLFILIFLFLSSYSLGAENKLKILLNFSETAFSVTATINLEKDDVKDFSFILANHLNIENISVDEGKKVEWKKVEEYSPTFRPWSKKIKITSPTPFKQIQIKYSGTQSTTFNIITEQFKSLNIYSAWYPQEETEKFSSAEVLVSNISDYVLLKGKYNANEKIWVYNLVPYAGVLDVNILAYKKSSMILTSGKYTNIYYMEPKFSKIAKQLDDTMKQVGNYYNGNLFKKRNLGKIDIADNYPVGGDGFYYKRDGLIVVPSLQYFSDSIRAQSVIGHELAHEWCSGADVDSWEDWLNETTAEWAMYLYFIEKGEVKTFNKLISEEHGNIKNLPPIRSADGKRPNGVHSKGVLLFNEIYKYYGEDTVKKMVQIFSELKVKNTENYLAAIRTQLSEEIAKFVEVGLTK